VEEMMTQLLDPKLSRPGMPKDYGILDESQGSGLLPWRRASEQLAKARNYWIHTTRADGRPHAMPVWGLWFEERFYFSTGPTSVNGRNLAANPSLVVHLESGDDSVILEGTAERVKDKGLLKRLDEAYRAKYDFPLVNEAGEGNIYTLDHSLAFAWLERDFIGSATRYIFET
jgi:hypothetical protein